MFEGKACILSPERCYTWVGITYTRLKRLVKDKHCSSYGLFISNEGKKSYNIDFNVLKPFFFVIDAQSEKAKAFVPLQSSLMFEDKAYMLYYDGCPNLVGFDRPPNITYARLLKKVHQGQTL
jgi:hypothetical protein